jgi:FkbM family methyltransferase
MKLKRLIKHIAMDFHFYGPLRKIRRRLFDPEALHSFRNELALYSRFISPGDLCFDVGCNVGDKTEVFLALGARVVAFDPQPNCFRETVARSGPNRRLTAINQAVGAMPGELPMYISRHCGSSSLVAGWSGEVQGVIHVPVTTLDQAIDRFGLPRFCKIDVEGFELEVIRGLHHPVPYITIEYHHEEKDIQKVIDCIRLLSRLGELSMNATFGESSDLVWTDWVPYESLPEFIPARLPRTATCGYGDLFIRIR